jgi:hypothetical protein
MGGEGAQIGGGGVGEGAMALQMAGGGTAEACWSRQTEGGDLGEKTEQQGGRKEDRARAAKTCGRGTGCKENRMGGLVLQRKVTLVTDVWAFKHLGLQVSRLFYLIRRTTR